MNDTKSENKPLSTIVSGAYYHVIGKVISEGSSFVINFLLSWYLGASVYGVYSYARTISLTSRQFVNLGSDKGLLRYLPESKGNQTRQSQIFTSGLIISISGGFITGLVIIVFSPLISELTLDSRVFIISLRIFGVIIFFNAIIRCISSSFRALELVQSEILIEKIVRRLMALSFIVLIILAGYEFIEILFGVLISTLVLTVVSVILLNQDTELTITPPNNSEFSNFLSFSIPLTIKDAGSLLYTRIDILMVGAFLSSASVGIYNISLLFASIILFPLGAFNRLYPTIASELYSDGEVTQLQIILQNVTRWIVTFSLPIFLCIVVYGDDILNLIGPKFASGSLVLLILATGQMVNTSAGPVGYTLIMTNHQYIAMINQWFFGIFNIILNYILILEFGSLGAAIATATTFSLSNIVRIFEVWYLEDLFPYSITIYKPITAGAISILCMFALQPFFTDIYLIILGTASGIGVYALVLYFLGLDHRDEILINKLA